MLILPSEIEKDSCRIEITNFLCCPAHVVIIIIAEVGECGEQPRQNNPLDGSCFSPEPSAKYVI